MIIKLQYNKERKRLEISIAKTFLYSLLLIMYIIQIVFFLWFALHITPTYHLEDEIYTANILNTILFVFNIFVIMFISIIVYDELKSKIRIRIV